MSLAINWRSFTWYDTTTLHYISGKDGDDLDTGLTKADPKKTLGAFFSSSFGSIRIHVRSGYYNEGDFTTQNSTVKEVRGDGVVVFDGSGGLITSLLNTSDSKEPYYFNNIILISYTQGVSNTGYAIFDGCILKDCLFNKSSSDTVIFDVSGINRSLLINTTLSYHGGLGGNIPVKFLSLLSKISYCTFINSSLYILKNAYTGIVNILNCYFDDDSLIAEGTNTTKTWTNLNFTNCAFKYDSGSGTTILGSELSALIIGLDVDDIIATYADGQKFSGSVTVANVSVTFLNCFWTANAGFLDETNELYLLKSDSKLFNNRNVIGKYQQGILVNATLDHFDPVNTGVVLTNVTRNGSIFELDTGHNTGTIVGSTDVSYAIDFGQLITINTEFITSFLGFNFFNGEWVDRLNYDAGVNDEIRLTIKIQIYDEAFSDWGSIYEFEINQKPTVDASNKGNGDIAFDFSNTSTIQARRIRIHELVIRDNGV